MPNKEALFSEELVIVRNSGEIPEIAFHSALHYLSADPEGPRLMLDAADLRRLEEQVIARYREIMLRDLDPANRDLRLYRGVRRCIFNWERLGKFLARQQRPEPPGLRAEIADQLCAFLHVEAREVQEGRRSSAVNCTAGELEGFWRLLAVVPCRLPADWARLCLPDGEEG